MSFGKFSNWLLPKNLWTNDESYSTCNKCSAEICARNRCRVIAAKIIPLCCILSMFLHSLRVRFSSRVTLKPREKQVPAAPKSLKANVDKPPLKYKAVWRENVATEFREKLNSCRLWRISKEERLKLEQLVPLPICFNVIFEYESDLRSNKYYLSSSEKKACTGFEPMTSAIPVQCSINWANKPSGSWSLCWFQINPELK